MRASRLLPVLLASVLVAVLTPPVGAAPAPVARTFAMTDGDAESGYVSVFVACTGTGPADQSARTVVECDIYDDSTRPSIHHERSFAGGAGACFVYARALKMPIEFCTTVTVQYRDLSQQSHTQCGRSGDGQPPRNAPAPSTSGPLECADLVDV